jgi:HSP20 family protein
MHSADREGEVKMLVRSDVYEEGDKLILEAELPGASFCDLELRVRGSVVTIAGRSAEGGDTDPRLYHRRERRTGEFRREIALPYRVDEDCVDAVLCRGTLVIRMAIEKRERDAIGACIPIRRHLEV